MMMPQEFRETLPCGTILHHRENQIRIHLHEGALAPVKIDKDKEQYDFLKAFRVLLSGLLFFTFVAPPLCAFLFQEGILKKSQKLHLPQNIPSVA